MVVYFIYILFTLMFISIIKSTYRIVISYFFLEKKNLKNKNKNGEKINIIIPIYNEQNIIYESINNFLEISKLKNVKVIYVSKNEVVNPTTGSLVKKYLTKFNIPKENIELFHYDSFDGIMAHQINYACKKIKKNEIIWLHNVDSIPNYNILDYIKNEFNKEFFYQQPSCYNILNKHKNIMASAIAWQNRWSIAYEIPKYLSKKNNYKYTIGHGAIFSKNLYTLFQGYPENDANEDNVLGFILSQLKIPIKVIPYFDEVGSTESKLTYIKQQSIWFNGPLYAFKYMNKYKYSSFFKRFILSLQNYKTAMSWFLWPFMTLVILSYSFLYNRKDLFIQIFLLSFLYSSILNLLSFICIKKNLKNPKYPNIFYDYFYFLFRCFGPFYSFYKILLNRNYGVLNKTKTNKTLINI